MRTDDELAYWAKMEGKSECAAEDLYEQVDPHRVKREKKSPWFWEAAVVVALFALLLYAALSFRPEVEVVPDGAGQSFVQSER